jgi:phosphonoacetaldehyde hydrolase
VKAKLEAVIFDWAGTTVDHGSLAPVRVLTRVFAAHEITLTDEQARRDMGLLKRDHIERILAAPEISGQWKRVHGASPGPHDLDRLFAEFAPLQMQCLADYSRVIPGTAAVAAELRSRGIRIGSTTGYTRPMLEIVMGCAARQGYCPDLALTPDDVGGGRPKPWMCYRIALEFHLSSSASCVKIGDTPADIAEGRNAGMWTVGVTATGNEIGLSEEDFAVLSEDKKSRLLARASDNLLAAGAHFVVESVAQCGDTLNEIESRLRRGDRP